ncbi:MAG TPA: hypothetical protein VNQ77_15410 [Frankiaceae bacterium]|nr:hypothetical protein [Frankiaceae bacterium]
MRKPLLALVLLASALTPVSARATHVDNVAGVESCGARSVGGTRGLCVLVATSGTYLLDISLDGVFGFGWSKLTCLPSGPSGEAAFVAAEGVPYASRYVDLPGGLCTLEVSSSPGVTTYGSVHRL